MKTTLLSLILLMFVSAGYTQSKFIKVVGPNKGQLVYHAPIHPDAKSLAASSIPGAKSYDFTSIGTTYYDAQTYNYGNIMQRTWAFADGTVGGTWMSMGPNTDDPQRGAGYNFHDGIAWGEPNLHVGPEDNGGFPSYAQWGEDGEIIAVYKYATGEGPMYFYKREVKGQGDWEEAVLLPPDGCSIVWHTMMTSGENHEHIHLLAETYDAEYNGQANALLYYRSSDGGESWDIFEETIEGLGDDYYLTINHLSYIWANPVGNTIAFTYGFDHYGGKIFKSYDNGDTWEFMTVYTTGFDPTEPAPTESPKFGAGIGSSAIVLDSEGKAHVAFPRAVREFTADGAGYYSDADGLIYWNEDMPELDTATISATTMEYLLESGNIIGWVIGGDTYEFPAGQPTYAGGMCAFPSMAIDASDNLFVAYTAIAPEYSNGAVNFRHIYINASFDGGTTWGEPKDLNEDLIFIFSECVFPSMAPFIDENVHVTFQEDEEPGTFEWPAVQAERTENEILHMAIEKATLVGVEENQHTSVARVSECYPNPASDQTLVQVTLQRPAAVGIQVVNVMGQQTGIGQRADLKAGNNTVKLDVSDLAPGIYYCTIETDQQKITRKFIVKK